jgi:hypothetical protein
VTRKLSGVFAFSSPLLRLDRPLGFTTKGRDHKSCSCLADSCDSVCFSLSSASHLSPSLLTHTRIGFDLFVRYIPLQRYYSSTTLPLVPCMDVSESAAILGNSQTVADWEKAFCDQVTGSGLFACSGLPHSRRTPRKRLRLRLRLRMSDLSSRRESPSADMLPQNHGKNTGKLTETKITVFLAT